MDVKHQHNNTFSRETNLQTISSAHELIVDNFNMAKLAPQSFEWKFPSFPTKYATVAKETLPTGCDNDPVVNGFINPKTAERL